MTEVSGAYAQRLLMTLFLVSFGIYLFLATVTYTPFDPGWMHISSDTLQVSNASGVAGAWIADLLFGFLGWASLLIPMFLFIEAIQVWWPHSFLNRPFRYAAQFFILLATASLLFLFWQVPADTLDNASGGIIGYELGQSLSQILTIYGATLFLVVFNVVLLTLAFGIKWNRTFSTLKATPAYLQDLFYRNVPESESAFDRTTPSVKKEVIATAPKKSVEETELVEAPAVQEASVKAPQRDYSAEHLFNDMVAKEQRFQEQQVDVDDEAELERTIEKAHQLEQDSQRVVATGEVWRALNSGEDQRHKNDIDALLRAAEEDRPFSPEQHFQAVVQDHTAPIADPHYFQDDAPAQKKNVDWDDDEIFDELLAAVPNGKTATDVHSPFNTPEPVSHLHVVEDPIAVAEVVNSSVAASPVALQPAPSGIAKAQLDELDDLDEFLAEDWSEQKVATSDVRTSSSYAQSSAFVQAPIQHHNTVSTSATVAVAKEVLSKEAFIEAWQDTAGKPQEEDDFDFDAPLTDASGRPMSLSMQVAERRRDLSPLPGLDLLDEVDLNKKVNFTAEQLAVYLNYLKLNYKSSMSKPKWSKRSQGP